MAAMSPRLKPLLLPQLVDERVKSSVEDLPYAYHTTNSSSSDITSPVSPTFSSRGHYRGSSSTSSLDLASFQFQDGPSSPTQQQLTQKTSFRQLPDLVEEPFEREEDRSNFSDHFGLYSCLCDSPCEHRSNFENTFQRDVVPDYELDYDYGRLSEGGVSTAPWYYKKTDGAESPFLGLTTRLGSGLTNINPWKSSKTASPISSPTATEISLENALARALSSQSYSANQQMPDRFNELPALATPTMSCYDSVESIDSLCEMGSEMHLDGRATLLRDRAKATTPLLPPLMTSALARPPPESPLQSPTVAPSSATTETPAPPMPINYSRPSLSTKPSITSLRRVPTMVEIPLPLSAILQEHDEWSDRLGHANFTITPQPYEIDTIDPETMAKFREDWETARVNYTKHLVRTGENYGETSKIYGLTEAKWAETERRWRGIYEGVVKQTSAGHTSRQRSISDLRSRSRVRGRGRSGSASATIMGRPTDDKFFAEMQWRRLEDGVPSAVPWMRDAEGKFPERGDEDIVGPMHRAEAMVRSHSEEKYGSRFWKNLAGKVGLRR